MFDVFLDGQNNMYTDKWISDKNIISCRDSVNSRMWIHSETLT